MKPKYSLITFKELFIDMFIRRCHLLISAEFLKIMDDQLTSLFTPLTGIKPNRNIGVSPIADHELNYINARFSGINLYFFIISEPLPIRVGWESPSGRIYKIGDTDIDPHDIRFYFEDIDISWIHQRMKPKGLPFKLTGLTYELIVEFINMDCHIEMTLRDDRQGAQETYMKTINNFISDYNNKSEAQNRRMGVVHNWHFTCDKENLSYDIDLGSTGPDFIKKLLRLLSDMEVFKKIRIN